MQSLNPHDSITHMRNIPHKFNLPVGSSSVLEVGVPPHLIKQLIEAFFHDMAAEVEDDFMSLPKVQRKLSRRLKGQMLNAKS